MRASTEMSGGDDHRVDTFAYHLAQGTWLPADAYVARLEFDATVGAGAATRRALEAHLLEQVREDELELLKMLTCELIANAVIHPVRHAGGHVGLLVVAHRLLSGTRSPGRTPRSGRG